MIVSAEVVALIAAAVAVFAAVLAVRATALTARTILARQAPLESPVTVRVVDGQTRRDLGTDTRDYAFTVSLTNRTASEWRCDSPTLRVTYRTRANFLGAVDLAAATALVIGPGQSRDATVRFTTSNIIPRHCRIDEYTLVLVNTNGERLLVDASLPTVLQADTDGTGPTTWGWD